MDDGARISGTSEKVRYSTVWTTFLPSVYQGKSLGIPNKKFDSEGPMGPGVSGDNH